MNSLIRNQAKIPSKDVELTTDEVAEGLERRWLDTSDLVMLRLIRVLVQSSH